MMKRKLVLLCLSIPLIALMMTLGIEPVSAADTRVFVDPPVSYAQVGESFNITVRVADATNEHPVFSYCINMSFNPDILKYDNVTEGEFLKDQPEGISVLGPRVEQELGWFFFGVSTKGRHSGVAGDGSLAIVTFNVTNIGESWLNITNPHTELIEISPFGQPLGISCTLENGELIACAPPPIPTTIADLKTEIEALGSTGDIDNQGIVRGLVAKLNAAQRLIDKGKIDEVRSILEEDFIPQVQNLTDIHITPEAADILMESAEYILTHL
jgi:hypothetical protein